MVKIYPDMFLFVIDLSTVHLVVENLNSCFSCFIHSLFILVAVYAVFVSFTLGETHGQLAPSSIFFYS